MLTVPLSYKWKYIIQGSHILCTDNLLPCFQHGFIWVCGKFILYNNINTVDCTSVVHDVADGSAKQMPWQMVKPHMKMILHKTHWECHWYCATWHQYCDDLNQAYPYLHKVHDTSSSPCSPTHVGSLHPTPTAAYYQTCTMSMSTMVCKELGSPNRQVVQESTGVTVKMSI